MDSTIVNNTARWHQYNMANLLQDLTKETQQITREAAILGLVCECNVWSMFYARQFIMVFNNMLCWKVKIH